MRVLVDANVLLDVLLNRTPWNAVASELWDAHRSGRVNAHIAAFTLPTIFYVVRRQNDVPQAIAAVRACLETFEIVSVQRSSLERALQGAGPDFEDELQIACAAEAGLEGIVTRDPGDYIHQSAVPAVSPAELLARLPEAPSS
jgi:predicted nucleic acid-binding protein